MSWVSSCKATCVVKSLIQASLFRFCAPAGAIHDIDDAAKFATMVALAILSIKDLRLCSSRFYILSLELSCFVTGWHGVLAGGADFGNGLYNECVVALLMAHSPFDAAQV